MKRLIVAFVLLALPLVAAETDPLANVRFLLGDWIAAGGGKPGEATGTTTFAPALRGTAITRMSTDALAGEPRYRISYVLDAQDRLNGTFEIAPAKSPAEFATYLTWTSHR